VVDLECVGFRLSDVVSVPVGPEWFASSAKGFDQPDCEGIVAVGVRAASEGPDDSFRMSTRSPPSSADSGEPNWLPAGRCEGRASGRASSSRQARSSARATTSASPTCSSSSCHSLGDSRKGRSSPHLVSQPSARVILELDREDAGRLREPESLQPLTEQLQRLVPERCRRHRSRQGGETW
jgi:hypothetical protein